MTQAFLKVDAGQASLLRSTYVSLLLPSQRVQYANSVKFGPTTWLGLPLGPEDIRYRCSDPLGILEWGLRLVIGEEGVAFRQGLYSNATSTAHRPGILGALHKKRGPTKTAALSESAM